MIRELMDLLSDIDHIPEEWGLPYFKQEHYYDPFPLSTDNFHPFESVSNNRVVCSVDGGNNTIFESPSECIHLLRVYFNLFRGRTRLKNIEPFSGYLVSRPVEDSIVSVLYPINSTIPLGERKFVLNRDEVDGGSMMNAGHTVRRYLEWLVAEYAAKEYMNEGDILVKDGVLQTSVEEERGYANDLYRTCLGKGVILTGIAKTSSLMTTTGYPLLAAIRTLAEDTGYGRWNYHPMASNRHPDHMGDMYVVKYHASSDYVFRTEFHREQDIPVDEVLGELGVQAKDPVFLGYPYGLVDADKRARVTDEEVKYLRTLGTGMMGKSMRYRVNSMNAHDLLSDI